jgi:hypothetical protein
VAGKEDISAAFRGRNFGVGCPGGVEVVAHSLRDTLEKHKTSKLGLLKIDFRNAFNEVKRDHFVKAVSEMFPALSNWTQWCYGEATMLLYDHQHIIESCAGVQQGDPLGPLYFCCGINALVNEIAALNPVYNKWYMDDGGIVGDVELLKKVWEILKTRGPALGLHLNPSKCEWSWLNPACKAPCPIKLEGVSAENQVKLVPHSEIQMLGVPLGDDAFVSDFVEKKLLGRLQETVSKLVEFEDTQAASYLLRVSYSIVRAVHFMRTTPLRQWREQGEKFDGMVRTAAERILGFPMQERVYAQAAITPKLGGLGLRKSVEQADLAYSASWHESQKQAREVWVRPVQVNEAYVSQKDASYEFDKKMHKYLVDTAPNDREKQRLLRVAQPHAGGFVTATPSEEDGKDVILRPRVFRIAIRYRLGVPVLPNEIPCPLCMQTINIYGDHATCCRMAGDLITRHNTIRNFVNGIARAGLLNPVLEKQGILGSSDGRRPGDVTIPNWANGKGLCIDVAVTSPLITDSVRLANPCEEYAATKKHRKYDLSFGGTNYSLCAMVFETLGAVNSEGEAVLKQLFTFASQQLGKEYTSFCSRAWARVSCSLQRSVAQAILNRIGDLDRPPREESQQRPLEEEALVSVGTSLGEPSEATFVPEVPSVGGPSVGEPLGQPVGEPVSARRPVFNPRCVPPQIPVFPLSLFEDNKDSPCTPRRVPIPDFPLSLERASSSSSSKSTSSVCIYSLSGWSGRRGNTNKPEINTKTSPPPSNLSHCILATSHSFSGSSSPHHTTPVSPHFQTPNTGAELPAALHSQSLSLLGYNKEAAGGVRYSFLGRGAS